jgi:hypothetical protein
VKVQRAPRSSVQPQPAPAGLVRRDPGGAEPSGTPTAAVPSSPDPESLRLFSAGVDLDLTDPLRRRDEQAVAAEVIADLVFACRHEGVAGPSTVVRLLRPTSDGLVGVVLAAGADQSVAAVADALAASTTDLPVLTGDMLTVIHIGATRARPTGDWGLGGIGVATLGPVVPTIVSHRAAGDPSLSLTERLLAHLDLTVTDAGAHANGAVRAVDVLARAVEGPAR